MSETTGTATATGAATATADEGVERPFHWLAVATTVVLMGTYASVLYDATTVVGGSETLLSVAAGTLVAGALVARWLRLRWALALGSVLLALGLVGYYTAVPSAYVAAATIDRIVADNVALLTGLSILRMTQVGAWAIGVAPALLFAPWYLVLRRRYGLAAATGGLALGFFVLTGDAGTIVTLVGVLAGLGTLGFGTMARYGGRVEQLDALVVVLVAMVVVSMTVSVVPGGASNPIFPEGGPAQTVEGSVVSNDQRVSILGSIRLSPELRFRVTADRPAYWRVGAYDRYTGGDWVRTGESRSYRSLDAPPGASVPVRQRFAVEADRINAMPAAWKPVRVLGAARNLTRVTDMGGLKPDGQLRSGDSYTVVSRMPRWTETQLRSAGTAYPDRVTDRYLQLPESTSDRLARRTANVTADATNPYDAARDVERWLESNKEYSLTVDRPDGNIAERFVFDMQRGYCVYYATAMVSMLRTQDIPARFVVGYTPGQRVADDEWEVRGLDSHAWVEVYFPDVGWVQFDPTPAGPRQAAEQGQLADANVTSSADGTPVTTTTTATAEPTTDGEPNGTDAGAGAETETTTTAGGPPTPSQPDDRRSEPSLDRLGETTTDDDANGGLPFEPPSREQTAFGLVVLVGAFAGARRTGAFERAKRAVWLRWQPRTDPGTDVERAFARLEHLLGRRYRDRKPGETPREYFDALSNVGLDERARRVGDLYERARYAGTVDDDTATEAVELVDDLVAERTSLLGWLGRR